MANCCTPEYIKIPSVGISGDIILKRSEPGVFPYVLPIELEAENDPSCGYYEYFSGTPELNYYDYYEIDVQYNSGSGFWTFSGNSTGFDDSTVYRSVKTGNPCDPLGSYIGGFYTIDITEGNKFNIYDFETSFLRASENDGQAVGRSIHKNKDVTFKFEIPIGRRGSFVESICFDVLSENGTTVYENYSKGLATSIKITEAENIKIFGSYTKDFGVRARIIDKLLGETSSAEFYVYGNLLNIDSLSVQDKEGTTQWEATSKSENAETNGVNPSGAIPTNQPRIQLKTNLYGDLFNLSHMNLYASETENFNPGPSNFKNRINLKNGTKTKTININESVGLKPNKDYYFAVEGYSKLGKGNTVKFGPHKIFEKEKPGIPIKTTDVVFSYKNSNYLNEFRTGNITDNLIGSSGIIDTLIIDKEDYTRTKGVYNKEKYLFSTLPTNASGKWKYTSFDYNFEFKDKDDDYANLNKKIKITATGTSLDPLNSGLPLFKLTDENTGVAVDVDILYNQSGLYLVCNTGHQYEYYKYKKDSF